MIRAITKRDWFHVDRETARPVWGVPGANLVKNNPMMFELHRSHLVLFDAAPPIMQQRPRSEVWRNRDAWTQARGFTLRTAQQQAIDFVSDRASAMIADDMRVGKTLASLMCHTPARGPLVIVAPLSTRAVWLGWARRVFPDASIGVLAGRTFDRAKLDNPIIFAHYDIIRHWQVDMPIGTLIFDEAHLLTNPKSQRTNAATFLRNRAKVAIPMTGTPIWKFPPDFWSVLNLAVPGAWGSYYDFAQRYGGPIPTAYGTKYAGSSNEKELHTRLTEVMIRRRWIDVADDLPPITRSVVISEVSDAQRKRLDILAAELASERTNTAANLARYRRVVSAIKATTVVQETTKIVSRDEPVVVWTWHKDYANSLADRLTELGSTAFVIHGDVPASERERRMEAWKASPNAVLVATMAVAQVGIDLSHARVAIFAEIDYTPAVLGQAEMRTFAPTRPMDVIFTVANHFVDQRIIRTLVAKLGAADPFGVAAAIDAIDAMRDAVLGPKVEGDLDRLLEDFLASAA